jgi:hypothetical protein
MYLHKKSYKKSYEKKKLLTSGDCEIWIVSWTCESPFELSALSKFVTETSLLYASLASFDSVLHLSLKYFWPVIWQAKGSGDCDKKTNCQIKYVVAKL